MAPLTDPSLECTLITSLKCQKVNSAALSVEAKAGRNFFAKTRELEMLNTAFQSCWDTIVARHHCQKENRSQHLKLSGSYLFL